MRFYLLVFVLSISPHICFSTQPPDTLWTKTFGGPEDDWAHAVIQTSDGGYIITGCTESYGAGMGDVWLIKTDPKGDTLWTRTFGGAEEDWGNSVVQTSEGGYIIVGCTKSLGAGSTDVYLIKTDANGDTLWTKTYGGTDDDGGWSVIQTSEEEYIIVGSTESYSESRGSNVWLIKIDANGDTLWTKIYGGIEVTRGLSFAQTSDEGYIISGEITVTGGNPDVYMVKTDANGGVLWTNTFGEYMHIEWGNSVIQISDKGYIIAGGVTYYGTGQVDLLLIRTDARGDALWTKHFGGGQDDWGGSVTQTQDGEYIITGCTYSYSTGAGDLWVIKANINGDTLWTKTFGGVNLDLGYSIAQIFDGGYIITGGTSSYGAGGYDVWLLKLSPEAGIVEKGNISRDAHIYVSENPFNPELGRMNIRFSISEKAIASVRVYDILGNLKATLMEKNPGEAGVEQRTAWDGKGEDGKCVSSGIYIIMVTTDKGKRDVCKITVVR